MHIATAVWRYRYRDGRRYKPLPVEPDDADLADEWGYGDQFHMERESGFELEMSDLAVSPSSSPSATTAASSPPLRKPPPSRSALSDQRVTRRREQSESIGEEHETSVTV